MADSSDGASSGTSVIVRARPFSRMRLRVSAYANTKAAGTVTTMTTALTHTLFHTDCISAGVCA